MGAGVEPGEAAAEVDEAGAAAVEVGAVDVGDLELAAGLGPQAVGDVDDVVVVEVEPGDGAVGPGLRALLLDGDQAAVAVGLADAVALGVLDRVAE